LSNKKEQTIFYTTLHKKQKIEQHEPILKWDELMCSGMESRVLLDMWQSSNYSSYKPGGKSWIRKGLDCVWTRLVYTVFTTCGSVVFVEEIGVIEKQKRHSRNHW